VRILALALGTFVISSGVYLIAGLLPDVAARGGVSVAAAGQLITVHALTCAIAAPLLSALFGGADRRRLLWTGMALFVAGSVATAVVPSFAGLVLARVVSAVGASLFTPMATVIAADLAPAHRRARAAAVVTGGMTLATVIGVPAGLMLRASLGFGGVFWLVAALGCAVALAVFAVPRTAAPAWEDTEAASGAGASGGRARGTASVLGVRAVRIVLAASLLGALADFAAYTYSVPMFGHFGGGSLHAILLAYGIAGAVGNVLGGRITDRFGSAAGIASALGALALGLVALPLAQGSVAGTLVAVVLWGAGGWGIMPAAQHRVLAWAPWAAGVAISLNASAVYLGMAAGGVVGGAVLGTLGAITLGPIGAVIAVAGLVVFGGTRLRGLRELRLASGKSVARFAALPVVRFPLGSRVVAATWLPRTREPRPRAARVRQAPALSYFCSPLLLTGAAEHR
jgi:DHA1 family purine base/nucleoside efflux pump-like MFS transporter